MFYSHEILTSPEHGVATIWLVATLGPKSITKKLNRKAILDVDVPKACNVIRDPAAPMALRLQGNLLYGVSKVYNQQCGYALTDVQTMHDRMKLMLRVVPGGGLDPSAGKVKPDQLILPYDPSFLPENDIPGISIDFSKWRIAIDADTSQDSDFAWPRTPDLSQSAISRNTSLQLSFSSGDIMMKELMRFGSETDVGSVQRSTEFARFAASAIGEEQGILLQPDFEFDEDGNIVELAGSQFRSEVRQRRELRLISETPIFGALRDDAVNDIFGDDQPMNMNDDLAINLGDRAHTPAPAGDIRQSIELAASEARDEMDVAPDAAEATARQSRRRQPKLIPVDTDTVLQNTELADLMDHYLQNMTSAWEQQQQDQISSQAKENAAFWVFGKGIGSVGIGVGVTHFTHPLQLFSGQELYETLSPFAMPKKRKRGRPPGKNDDMESETRRVRAREELEAQVGRGHDEGVNWQEEVEIGRQASAIRDDSSIMPWNITASVQSSQRGSVTASIFRGIGNTSDFSSHGFGEPSGLGLHRSRLTSASPLAGRGFPPDIDGLPGFTDDDLEDFDLSRYLQTESHTDNYANAMDLDTTGTNKGKEPVRNPPLPLRDRIIQSNLDQDSLNFLEFVMKKIEELSMNPFEDNQAHGDEDAYTNPSIHLKGLAFSTLLPRRKTSRAVATHGLTHTLALATKGILSVRQEAYKDLSTEEYGAKYEYGEIFLRLV